MGAHHHHGHSSCKQRVTDSKNSNSTRNIGFALAANMSFAVIELVGGYWTNSTAIQADAIHDFGDSFALMGALLLQYLAAVPPRSGFHFGLRRLSLLSAVMTSLLLVAGSVFVMYTALIRLQNPVHPHVSGMFGLALLGVAVNGYAAWKIGRGHTQNEKALAWHMMEDLLGWVAILVSSVVMYFVEVPWLDPTLAVVIAIVILGGASRSFWQGLRLFLQAVPIGVDEIAMRQALTQVDGVEEIKSLYLWSLDGERHICTMQVRLKSEVDMHQWPKVRHRIEHVMEDYGSFETTVEPV